jgi:glycosyltransferase involved in cell wall biosynthesis
MLTSEFLPVRGGIGNYVVELAKRIPNEHELHVVAPKGRFANSETTTPREDDATRFPSNVHIHRYGKDMEGFLGNLAFQISCPGILKTIVAKHDIDIIHTQSQMPDYFVSPGGLKIPTVTTVHTTVEGHNRTLRSPHINRRDMNGSEKLVLLGGPLLVAMERRYYTNQRHYISVSEWGRRNLVAEKRVDLERTRAIHIGVDTTRFNPDKKEEAKRIFGNIASNGNPKILFLSRMAARKGINVLMKAIPKVQEKVDAEFIIGGPGRLPVGDLPKKGCSYIGYLDSDKVPYMYALSDVYVLPSMYENFPSCLLEAMSSRSVPLSTAVCGIPEMIESGQNGILIPPNDVDALAKSIVELVDDHSLRTKLAANARKTVESKFDWSKTVAETVTYYGDIVDER